MGRPEVQDGSDPKAVRDTRVLIDCLQELVRGAYRPVRNCRKYQQVVWLADVPEGVVRRSLDADPRIMVIKHRPPKEAPRLPRILRGRVPADAAARAGTAPPELLGTASMDRRPDGSDAARDMGERALASGSSEVRESYEAWAARWERWAKEELAAEPHMLLYRQMYRMAKRIQQDGDTFEAVLAVGLLQIGAERASARVRRHIVTVPVSFTVDSQSLNVTVSLVPEEPGRLEDMEFLSASDGYTSELLRPVRSAIEDAPCQPLSGQAMEALRSWSQRAFGVERTLPFEPTREHPDLTGDPHTFSLHNAPALILREHGRRSVLGFYESIARFLRRPGVQAPLGLAQLLYDLEPERRTRWTSGSRATTPALGPDALFPMVTNAAQRDVLDRLQRDTSVVVQGPPGTGKTHTISNLIAALLADGKRVLVTSEKGQALKVLRDQLPARLRSMCVLQRDQWQGGSTDLRQSLGALSHLNATTNLDRLQQRIDACQAQRHQLMAEQAELREELRAIREVEWYEHPEVAPGYRGRLDEMVQAVTCDARAHEWLPPLPPHSAQMPPLNADEAQRLWALATQHGPGILDPRSQYCPDPASLPNPVDVVRCMRDLEAAERSLGSHSVTPLAQTLADTGDTELTALEALLARAQKALQSVGLSADPQSWEPDTWTTRALQDGMAHRWQQMWDSIRNASKRAQMTHEEIAAADFLDVDIPEVSESEEKELLVNGRNLERYLLNNGNLNKRWPRPPVIKQARFLLQRCRVEGMVPAGPEQITALVRHLEMRAHARTLNGRWAGVGATISEDTPEQTVAELLDRAVTLQAVDSCVEVIRQVHQTLLAYGIEVPVTTADHWEDVRQATAVARQLVHVRSASKRLDDLLADLSRLRRKGVEEIQGVVEAASARDAPAYAQAMDALATAYQREADRREAGKLFQRLAEAHPQLAHDFAAAPLAAHWRSRFAGLPQAWGWRHAQEYLEAHLLPGREDELEAGLTQIETRLHDVVEQLVCDRAAHHCVSRMTTRQKQALAAYASAIANAGQGTTEYGRRHQRHARSAMQTAQGAVPAWIMPLRQVAEMIRPEPDSFDVVIVDEASQVGLDGLLLLWLAPRIIVVGDDRQCAPFYSGSKHDRITQFFDERLEDLEPWQREGFDPKSNLYELLSSRFTEVIRLTEHFRCMPEIINWSSLQFYRDNQLVLLRQHGSDRLPPLKVVHVPDGYCEGRRERLINRPEAEAIVEQLRRLTLDAAYADRSIGVIVLRHGAQVGLVQDLVDQCIDVVARERHNIQVGTPEKFQGDQRDVILLSLVVDGDHVIAATGRHHERRFNVAASRARDQMWLFHSVTVDQLSSKDLRRSLLSYMQSPPPPYTLPVNRATSARTDSAHRSSPSSNSASTCVSKNAATTWCRNGKSTVSSSTSWSRGTTDASLWSATEVPTTRPSSRSTTMRSVSESCAAQDGPSGAYVVVPLLFHQKKPCSLCGHAWANWISGRAPVWNQT